MATGGSSAPLASPSNDARLTTLDIDVVIKSVANVVKALPVLPQMPTLATTKQFEPSYTR